MKHKTAAVLLGAALAAASTGGFAAAGSASHPPSPAQAQKILKKTKPLAAQGDASAQYNMGVLYAEGYGVARNYKTALHWYEKAAAQHYAKAEHNLGILYASGHGVAKNPARAAHWFKRAAHDGEPASQNNLAVLYARGQGLPRDMGQAALWAARAARAGNQSAIANVPHIVAHLPQPRIKGNDVNIRAQPNKSAHVLRKANDNTRVVRLTKKNKWSRVLFPKDYTLGWVANSLLATAAPPGPQSAEAGQIQGSRAQNNKVTANAGARGSDGQKTPAGPAQSTSGDNRPGGQKASAVTARSTSSKTGSGGAGKKSRNRASGHNKTHATGVTRHITGTGVNVRAAPGTDAKIRFRASNGDKVTVLRQKHGWRRVRFSDGRTGWVAAFLLGK